MNEILHEVFEMGGTVTGEHGIGSLKNDWARADLGQRITQMHAAVKAALDPQSIMNPGKAF